MLPKLHFTIERWKYNPTFELYVSNLGHIRNKSKADIAPKVTQNGYMTVKVHGSINRHMLLHRVVMLTWKPTPEAEALTVDHLDHNKRNNALSNLEWVLQEENLRRANNDLVSKEDVADFHLATPILSGKSPYLMISIKKEQQAKGLVGPYCIENNTKSIEDFIAFAGQFPGTKNILPGKNKFLARIEMMNDGKIKQADFCGLTAVPWNINN